LDNNIDSNAILFIFELFSLVEVFVT